GGVAAAGRGGKRGGAVNAVRSEKRKARAPAEEQQQQQLKAVETAGNSKAEIPEPGSKRIRTAESGMEIAAASTAVPSIAEASESGTDGTSVTEPVEAAVDT
ncbi:hypothetical protein LPJ66_010232, partial [Kickxella alabastrina]